MKIERLDLFGHEVRQAEDEERIIGVGLRYRSLSVDMGGWHEEFEPDAFRDSIEEDDIRIIWQHDSKMPLGRVRIGTARVWSDDDALRYEASPPNTTYARDAVELIRRGEVDQNSFAFQALDDDVVNRGGKTVRIVRRARLVEIGPQTFPAYTDTSVAVRARYEAMPEATVRKLEARGVGVDVAERIMRSRRRAA